MDVDDIDDIDIDRPIPQLLYKRKWKKRRFQAASALSPDPVLPGGKGKGHQAWLPAAGRVNTARPEMNHLSSMYPDTFSKDPSPAANGAQASRSHPWLWQPGW